MIPEKIGASGSNGDPPPKKLKPTQGEKQKAGSYCFAFFAVDGCEAIRAGILQRNGPLRTDAFEALPHPDLLCLSCVPCRGSSSEECSSAPQ
jgi:hypothetical protein